MRWMLERNFEVSRKSKGALLVRSQRYSAIAPRVILHISVFPLLGVKMRLRAYHPPASPCSPRGFACGTT